MRPVSARVRIPSDSVQSPSLALLRKSLEQSAAAFKDPGIDRVESGKVFTDGLDFDFRGAALGRVIEIRAGRNLAVDSEQCFTVEKFGFAQTLYRFRKKHVLGHGEEETVSRVGFRGETRHRFVSPNPGWDQVIGRFGRLSSIESRISFPR